MGENTANGTEATVVSANADVRRAAAAKTGAGATGEPSVSMTAQSCMYTRAIGLTLTSR